MTELERLSERT